MLKALKAVAGIAATSFAVYNYGHNILELPFALETYQKYKTNHCEQSWNFLLAQAKALDYDSVEKPPVKDVQSALQKRWVIMQHGYPSLDNLKQYDNHVLAYSNIHRAPLWVCEHITPKTLTSNENISRSNNFKVDDSIHTYFRSSNKDYLNSGYDRGHLAAAGNHKHSQRAMDETFYLTNICPQTGKGLNRSKWNDLEKRGRTLARKHGSVHVLTGPLFLPTVVAGEKFMKYKLIGENNVAVPTHFFKVILTTDRHGLHHLESYVMPNEEIRDDLPITTFMVPKEAIEKGAGFLVFDNVQGELIRSTNGVEMK